MVNNAIDMCLSRMASSLILSRKLIIIDGCEMMFMDEISAPVNGCFVDIEVCWVGNMGGVCDVVGVQMLTK